MLLHSHTRNNSFPYFFSSEFATNTEALHMLCETPPPSPRSALTVHRRSSSSCALFNPRLPPPLAPQTNTHTHTRQSADHVSLPLRGARNAASETQAPQNEFSDRGKRTKRGKAGNQEPTYGSHHDRSSLMEHWLCEIFVPSRWAGRAACCLRLRGAQQPGELLRHAEA